MSCHRRNLPASLHASVWSYQSTVTGHSENFSWRWRKSETFSWNWSSRLKRADFSNIWFLKPFRFQPGLWSRSYSLKSLKKSSFFTVTPPRPSIKSITLNCFHCAKIPLQTPLTYSHSQWLTCLMMWSSGRLALVKSPLAYRAADSRRGWLKGCESAVSFAKQVPHTHKMVLLHPQIQPRSSRSTPARCVVCPNQKSFHAGTQNGVTFNPTPLPGLELILARPGEKVKGLKADRDLRESAYEYLLEIEKSSSCWSCPMIGSLFGMIN